MGIRDIDPALREYLGHLEDSVAASKPSVFWQRQLGKANLYQIPPDEDVEGVAQRVGRAYGFDQLPAEIANVKQDPDYLAGRQALARAISIAKQLDPARQGVDKATWEHMRAIGFLEVNGLLDEYLDFIAPLRIRSTMSSARHWYYARQLAELVGRTHPDKPKLDILEIGAGAGNLATFLARMGLVRSYTIVDLPQMLVHAAFTTQHHVPDVDLRFEREPAANSWTFLSDGVAGGVLEPGSFDLCLNLNSFMEMDREARDGYIDLIYRTARRGALFFNVNRRQRALPLPDGSTWDNNPLLFPYRSDDDILVWEEDPFETVTRTKFSLLTTLAVMRASIIRSPTLPRSAPGGLTRG